MKPGPSPHAPPERSPLEIEIAKERVVLDSRRGLWWPRGRSVFVADTHFGKDATARAQSLALPEGVTASDLRRLGELIADYSPETLWILGDVFDSAASGEGNTMDQIGAWCAAQSAAIAMVPGNHDRRATALANRCGIAIHPNHTRTGPWRLTHEPGTGRGGHGLCGHLHPGVRLSGAGKERLRLPCFVVGAEETILPAFSEFTGLAVHSRIADRQYYAIADRQVILLGPS